MLDNILEWCVIFAPLVLAILFFIFRVKSEDRSAHKRWRRILLTFGLLFSGLAVWQQQRAASAAAAASAANRATIDEQNKKIDDLKSLLDALGKNVSSPESRNFGALTISQRMMQSIRPDAKYQAEVVVSSNKVLPSARIKVDCNGQITAVQFDDSARTSLIPSSSQGIVIEPQKRQRFVFAYDVMRPEFGPSLPLTFQVWSAQQITCYQVEAEPS